MQTDDIVQNFFIAIKNMKWRDCESNNEYEWYYAEKCHYVVRKKSTNALWTIKAKSPDSACEIAMKKEKGL